MELVQLKLHLKLILLFNLLDFLLVTMNSVLELFFECSNAPLGILELGSQPSHLIRNKLEIILPMVLLLLEFRDFPFQIAHQLTLMSLSLVSFTERDVRPIKIECCIFIWVISIAVAAAL